MEGMHFQIVLIDPKTMLNVPQPTMPAEQLLGTERIKTLSYKVSAVKWYRVIPPGNDVAVSATCKLA